MGEASEFWHFRPFTKGGLACLRSSSVTDLEKNIEERLKNSEIPSCQFFSDDLQVFGILRLDIEGLQVGTTSKLTDTLQESSELDR
jgi:hypothetical protein